MKIAVIGTGYVGLVTATCLAESGNDVVGMDADPRKIEVLEAGRLPIYEPGLQELVQRNRREGRLNFTTSLAHAVGPAQLVFIAVGTPQAADGSADLKNLWNLAEALPEHLNGPKVLVIKSTVPVGTNRALADRLAGRARHPVDVASNPEFLKEGAAVEDFMKPDRVVVGVRRPEVAEVLRELHAPFLRTERPFLAMSPESAEMTKYAANAMLATKISFINEMANLCERLGADINDVRRGIGHDARIGFQFLFPGAGFGGSCFEGAETVFALDEGRLTTTTLEGLFRKGEPAGESECATAAHLRAGATEAGGVAVETAVEVRVPTGRLRVLAVDLDAGRPVLSDVLALTRRPYAGDLVTLRLGMSRTLRVTADHPVVLWTPEGYRTLPAEEVCTGDALAALGALPALPPVASLDLIQLLEGTGLEADAHVAPTDDSFTAQYGRFRAHVPPELVRYPTDIKSGNRMPLRLFRLLRAQGLIDVPTERLQLYTAKGAGARLNAVLPVDADLLRLCGYYLAEGFISRDVGRSGAVRQRIGFCFHAEEAEYTADVQRILARWGLKFLERRAGKALTTFVSSRVFAWLLRDVLGCGTRSEDKALPALAFNVPPELRLELLRGAFSGDGAVTPVQGGRNFMLEYATVSRGLANGLALLLQSLGIVPSLRPRWMNKSKQPAYLLRVSGHGQLDALREVFGGKRRDRIAGLLDGYQRIIRQRGFVRRGPVATLAVRAVVREPVDTTVYSLETSIGTVVAASGLVCHNCFPKDVRALIFTSRQLQSPLHLMEAVDQVNEAQKRVLAQKVQAHYGENVKEKTLAVWGLAFKPRTDDVREAPALVLLDALLAEGVALRVHDPEALANVRALYGDRLVYCDRPYGALEGADGLVIMTEWQEFRNPDFELMRRLMREATVFDGRNLYEPKTLTGHGFTYYGIGRHRG